MSTEDGFSVLMMIGYILILLRLVECFNINIKGVMFMVNRTIMEIYGIIGVIITISTIEMPSQPYRFNLLMRLWNSAEKVVKIKAKN